MSDTSELDKLLGLKVEDIEETEALGLKQTLNQAYRLIMPRLNSAHLTLVVKVADALSNHIGHHTQALLALILHSLNTITLQLSHSKVIIDVSQKDAELLIAIQCGKDKVRFDDLLSSDLVAQLCHQFGFQLSKSSATDHTGLNIKMTLATATDSKAKSLKFLIVEDNEINATLLKHFLSGYGDEIHHVVNGKLAVEYVALNPVDVIMMDINMPVMGGIEACKLIRNQKLQNQPVIIAVTANSTDGNKQACIEAGMNNFLSKPFSGAQIDDLLLPIVKSL